MPSSMLVAIDRDQVPELGELPTAMTLDESDGTEALGSAARGVVDVYREMR